MIFGRPHRNAKVYKNNCKRSLMHLITLEGLGVFAPRKNACAWTQERGWFTPESLQ